MFHHAKLGFTCDVVVCYWKKSQYRLWIFESAQWMAEPEHPDGPENRIIPRKQPPLHHRALAILRFFQAPIANGTTVSGPASILWVQSRDLKVLTLLPKYRQKVQYIRSGVRTDARKGNVGDWQVPGAFFVSVAVASCTPRVRHRMSIATY